MGPRPGREEGAVAVVVALLLTALLGVSAIVLDLGALRADRIAGKSIADMAAAAAAVNYQHHQEGEPLRACLTALDYSIENIGDIDTLTGLDGQACEDVFDASYVCSPTDENEAVYTDPDGDYRVTIVTPVRDGDDDFLQGLDHGAHDGQPCDRVGVRVERDRSFLFAPAAGFIEQGSTRPSSVARTFSGPRGEPASLIVLQERGCETIHASGGPTEIIVDGVWVDEAGNVVADDDPDRDEYKSGVITVDTDLPHDGCKQNEWIFELDGNDAEITADHIFSYALHLGHPENDVYPDHDGLDPDPVAGDKVTREAVDYLYNCTDYPAGDGPLWNPNRTGAVTIPIDDCDGDGEPHVKVLQEEYGYDALTAESAIAKGWAVIGGDDASEGMPTSCQNVDGVFGPDTAPDGTDGKHWFVDCPGDGNQGFRVNDVEFEDVETVVTRGRIRLGSDELTISGAEDVGAVLYMQEGDLRAEGGATIDFNDTFVYMERGRTNIAGNADISRWHAVRDTGFDRGDCPSYTGAPPAWCFSPLSLWTNHTGSHSLGGGGALNISGTFFTPNATPFTLHGGGGQTLKHAQFFAGALRADGGGTVHMRADPDLIPVEVDTGSALIR